MTEGEELVLQSSYVRDVIQVIIANAVIELVNSKKPAALLISEWHVQGVPFRFEHQDLYTEIAEVCAYSIIAMSRPEAGGSEHLLFMTSNNRLSEAACLACIDESAIRAWRRQDWVD